MKNSQNLVIKSRKLTKKIKDLVKSSNVTSGRRIDIGAKRANDEQKHAIRVKFAEEHFASSKVYHAPHPFVQKSVTKNKQTCSFRRVMYILVPSGFYTETDEIRTRKVYKGKNHRVEQVIDYTYKVKAHNEHACKYILLKHGTPEESITIGKNIVTVVLNKAVKEQSIRDLFPTFTIQVYKKVKRHGDK